MVEGAALEMLCTEMYLGFESLTLRQEESCKPAGLSGFFFFCILAKTGHFGLDFGCSFHKSGKNKNVVRHTVSKLNLLVRICEIFVGYITPLARKLT